MTTSEANFDGIVGPTHNYAGLSAGNLASQNNAGEVSHPKQAALQGLHKAKELADLGLVQHVLPPLERPDMGMLRELGFDGSDSEVLLAASTEAPHMLAAACSASAMWAANAATVSPSADTNDGRLHLTPANLACNLHRSIEPAQTRAVLSQVFSDQERFVVHEPLNATTRLFDEGAANHTRLCGTHGSPGIEMFCFGRPQNAANDIDCGTKRHSARQSEDASVAIARRHGVLDRAVFALQNPEAIDAGVFHNDVISVGNENVLLVHEHAFTDTPDVLARTRAKLSELCPDAPGLSVFTVTADELSVIDAVKTYLFNSQLITLPGKTGENRMMLVAPTEVQDHDGARAAAERLVRDIPEVGDVKYVDVRESMRNGGGPACLRLRVVMTDQERESLGGRTALDDALHSELVEWVSTSYRDTIAPADLADPNLIRESRDALDGLTRILRLGNVYPFQN